MGTSTCLQVAVEQAHEGLSGRLDAARLVHPRPEQSRRGCPPIDLFLSATSRHLHAVDQLMLPPLRTKCAEGSHLQHDYLHSLRGLEVVLAHVKAHEYGSAYETSFEWVGVWGAVDEALNDQRHQEEMIAGRLTEVLPDETLETVAARLGSADARLPSRPHPYLPHTGPAGAASRRVMRVVDRFWDAVEGRVTPEPAPPRKKRPGLLGQYLMADPRFGEEDEAEAMETVAPTDGDGRV